MSAACCLLPNISVVAREDGRGGLGSAPNPGATSPTSGLAVWAAVLGFTALTLGSFGLA